MDFTLLQSVPFFYSVDSENDKSVRKMWYIFCYYFLPKINKDWKECLQSSRLRKKSFIFDHITVSDEAMTQWFLNVWEPKILKEKESNWLLPERSYGEGEHELRTGLKVYVEIYNKITYCRKLDNGDAACRWNDIFWEEMVVNHPSAFTEYSSQKQLDTTFVPVKSTKEDTVVLPDIENDDEILELFKKRKSVTPILNSDGNFCSFSTVNYQSQNIDNQVNENIQNDKDDGNNDQQEGSNSNQNEDLTLTGIQAHPV